MKQNVTGKLLSLLFAATLSLSLAACNTSSSTSSTISMSVAPTLSSEATSSEAAQPTEAVIVTDQDGREVTVEGPVEKIVSGYYISTSAVIALGLSDKLVGIEANANKRPIYKLSAPALLELPNVGSAKEFNLEGCIALEPDLVILPKRLKESADALAELGIPVILVNPESHEDLVLMIELIGKAAGAEAKATAITSYYSSELERIAALTKDLKEKPLVYMAGNSAYLSTSPKDMYQASLIRAAGGINAADSIEGDNWVDVSYEQLVAINPDVIVIPADASYAKAELLADAQLTNLNAVKNSKIYEMPKGFEAWDSPVPSGMLGIRWLLHALHEDIYPLESLQADAAAFYRDFYGAEIDTSMIGK